MIRKNFTGINKRICLAFIIVTCAIVMSVSAILLLIFGNMMSRRMIENQKIFLQQNQTNVQNLVNSFNQISINLTTDEMIAELLNQRNIQELELYNGGVALKKQFARYTNAPLSNSLTTYYSNLYIFDDYEVVKALVGKPLQYDPQNLCGVYSAKDIIDDEWAQETIRQNGQLYTFVRPEEPQTVYLTRLISNIEVIPGKQRGQTIGIMIAGLSMQQFKQQVEALSLTENSEVYIIDQSTGKPQILYASSGKSGGEQLLNADMLHSTDAFAPGETVTIGHDKYLFMKYSTYWDWDIISLIPMSDITRELKGVLGVAIIIAVLGVLLGCVLIAVTSYTITKPLVNLTDIMRRINSGGDIFEVSRFELKHDDEIALLYDTFHKLMNRIEQLIQEGYESGIKKKEVELLALQAQINPHFIYNALDSINWIALCDGNDDIVEIVSSLADIVRYSIKNPNERVRLQDELTHVENYVKIQAKQSGRGIDIIFEIDRQFLNAKMPKFLLEPLVENCVIHGLCNMQSEGRIRVSCRREDDFLYLEVADNGIGADVELLNQYLAGEIDSLAHSDGFGVKNINERIKLNYGSDYGLCFFINGEKGLTSRIILPYHRLDLEENTEKSELAED